MLGMGEVVLEIFRPVQVYDDHKIRVGAAHGLTAEYLCIVQVGEFQLQFCVDLAAAEIEFGHIRVFCQL